MAMFLRCFNTKYVIANPETANPETANPETGSDFSMTDLLECPVCMEIMKPPIDQCSNGHAICFTCKAKVKNICPECRQELGNIRCLALEKVARKIYPPCKFHIFGCPDLISQDNALEHEKICSFRPFNCPFEISACKVTGDIKNLVAHLKEDHADYYIDVADGSTFNIPYKILDINPAKWNSALCYCFGHHFYLHFESFTIAQASVYMAFLRFMGSEKEADKFRYCFEVGGNGRKMTWEGVPRSIRADGKTVRDSQDGLIIHKNIALYFSNEGQEQMLQVASRIWRV